MKIKVTISRTNKTSELNLKNNSTVEQLIQTINLKPDTIIALKNDKPIPIDTNLNENDEIKIIQVSSGG